MNEFWQILNENWPIITGGLTFVFMLGITYQRANTSMSAIKRLFTTTTDLVEFKNKQEENNKYTERELDTFKEDLIRNHETANKKHEDAMKILTDLMSVLIRERRKDS